MYVVATGRKMLGETHPVSHTLVVALHVKVSLLNRKILHLAPSVVTSAST